MIGFMLIKTECWKHNNNLLEESVPFIFRITMLQCFLNQYSFIASKQWVSFLITMDTHNVMLKYDQNISENSMSLIYQSTVSVQPAKMDVVRMMETWENVSQMVALFAKVNGIAGF